MGSSEPLWFDPIKRSRLDQFELLQVIGVGAFSVVKLARYKPTNTFYAIKIVSKKQVISQGILEDVRNEKKILETINHPYIVKLYKTFQDSENIYFLMEYVVGGEITVHGTRFNGEIVAIWAAELVLIFHYLHMKGIVYRDLKPENILLDSSGHIKLTDFGLSKYLEESPNGHRRPTGTFESSEEADSRSRTPSRTHDSLSQRLSGTVEYLSPEIIKDGGYSLEDDWWSLGVLIFELLCGYPPFRSEMAWNDDTEMGYLRGIDRVEEAIHRRKIKFPGHLTPIEIDFILRLLNIDPMKRIGISECITGEIYSHPFFRNVDFAELLLGYGNTPLVPNNNCFGVCTNSNSGNVSPTPDYLGTVLTLPRLSPGATKDDSTKPSSTRKHSDDNLSNDDMIDGGTKEESSRPNQNKVTFDTQTTPSTGEGNTNKDGTPIIIPDGAFDGF